MTRLEDVDVPTLDLGLFEEVLPAPRWREVEEAIERSKTVLDRRTVWNLNSTSRGGGVAEMLWSLIGYARGVDVDARWLTIAGTPPFFELTKRLHNRLHGDRGDGGPLDDEARELYEAASREFAGELMARLDERDLVILHDPQTAGMVPLLRKSGARIAWRSHIGHDRPNELAMRAWEFLLPYVVHADVCVFSRPSYAWGGLPREQMEFIHPSIDVFSPKNRGLSPARVLSVLGAAGVLDGASAEHEHEHQHEHERGHEHRSADEALAIPAIRREAQMVEESRLEPGTPVVLQVSRWDRLKDPCGVMQGFAEHVREAHLVLAGPDVSAVSDDPEGSAVLAETTERWAALEPSVRARVHLATLPMEDPRENAVMVNALQRHARVVCQKSIAEGFGLTVAEAMWKGRPLVASRVGGIQDQIEHGVTGLLVDDPRDLRGFGDAVRALLGGAAEADRLARGAHLRAREEFLGPAHLMRYLALFERLLA